MDLRKVIAQLRNELQSLDMAIQSLERVRQSSRRRGRPPSWLTGGKKMRKSNRKKGRKPRGPGANAQGGNP